MDTDLIVELVPHYVAMVVLVFLVLGALRAVVGETRLVVDLLVIGVVVFSYRPVARRLGVAPTLWERR